MTLFMSTFEFKVDKKGRVSVPASFRAALNEAKSANVIVTRDHRELAITGNTEAWMQRMVAHIEQLPMYSPEREALETTIFADGLSLSFDNEGRILLPKLLMDHAGIVDRATFVGLGPRFQIWQPERYADYNERQRRTARSVQLPPMASV